MPGKVNRAGCHWNSRKLKWNLQGGVLKKKLLRKSRELGAVGISHYQNL